MTGFSLSPTPTPADGVKVAASAAAAAAKVDDDDDDDAEDLLGRSLLPALLLELFRASSYMRSFVSFEKQKIN